MSHEISGLTGRCLGYSAATIFIVASASQNALHGWHLGLRTSETTATIFAAASIAGAIMTPIALAATFRAFRNLEIVRGLVAMLIAACCFCYAIVSSLGFVTGARDAAAATRGADVDAYAIAKARAGAAMAELKGLAAARPAGELQAQIDALKHDRLYVRSRECTNATAVASRTFCGKLETLAAEKARAERRAELDLAITSAQKAMGAHGGVGAADPTASAISAYAGALGFAVEPEKLSPWLSLLAIAFFEINAAASLVVVGSPARGREPEKIEAATARAATPADPAVTAPARATEPLAEKRRGRKRAQPLETVRERIEIAGGKLEGSFDEIGKQLGLSPSSARRALHTLHAMGAISLASSAAGTLVQMRG